LKERGGCRRASAAGERKQSAKTKWKGVKLGLLLNF